MLFHERHVPLPNLDRPFAFSEKERRSVMCIETKPGMDLPVKKLASKRRPFDHIKCPHQGVQVIHFRESAAVGDFADLSRRITQKPKVTLKPHQAWALRPFQQFKTFTLLGVYQSLKGAVHAQKA